MKRKLSRLLSVISIAVILLITTAIPVFAIESPDAFSINAIYAFRNVKETGDMLFLIDQTVDYNTLPAENAYSAVQTDFIDEDGVTVIANGTIFAFYKYGYGRSAMILYFSAANCTANAMVWLDAFDFTMRGNPALVWTSGAPTTTANIDYWSTETAVVDVQTELAARIISVTQTLNEAWEYSGTTNTLLEYTTGGLMLSETGQAYWLGVAPGLNNIAPDAFGVRIEVPDVHKREYGNQGALDLAAQLIGTPWDLTPLATELGMTIGWLNSIITLGVIVAIDIIFSRQINMSTRGLILIDDFIFVAAAVSGALPLMIVLGGAAVAAFFTLNVFFLSKANV